MHEQRNFNSPLIGEDANTIKGSNCFSQAVHSSAMEGGTSLDDGSLQSVPVAAFGRRQSLLGLLQELIAHRTATEYV